MKIRNIKKISSIITLVIILGVPYLKRCLNYRMNISDGAYRLYDDQNAECGEIKVQNTKIGSVRYLTCNYSIDGKSESINLKLLKNKHGHYYCLKKDENVYVLVKSFDRSHGYFYDAKNEKIQNQFHLFCISQDFYNELLARMKFEHFYFCDYFNPALERKVSLHFGKTRI